MQGCFYLVRHFAGLLKRDELTFGTGATITPQQAVQTSASRLAYLALALGRNFVLGGRNLVFIRNFAKGNRVESYSFTPV